MHQQDLNSNSVDNSNSDDLSVNSNSNSDSDSDSYMEPDPLISKDSTVNPGGPREIRQNTFIVSQVCTDMIIYE